MQASDNIKAYIKKTEDFVSHAYLDPPHNTKGLHSIGYGHQIQPNEKALLTKTITRAEGDLLFDSDIRAVEYSINKSLKRPVVQDQFDAFVDIGFNAGAGAAQKTINTWNMTGDTTQTANHIMKYVHSNGAVNPTLVKRRGFDANLFQGKGSVAVITDVAKKKVPGTS